MAKTDLYENEEIQERALLDRWIPGEFDAQASLAELYELTRSGRRHSPMAP